MGQFARDIITNLGMDDSFFVVDLGRLCRLHQAFVSAMPRVRPHYAIKCNPDPVMLRVLAALGAGFDCASAGEVQAALQAGAGPEDIILAQACKRPVDLRVAAASNVRLTTFDCESELDKIAEAWPAAHVVLRIRADDPTADVPLSSKFGADPAAEAPALLAAAALRGLSLAGVAFHVGSGSHDASAYARAIHLARGVFDCAVAIGMCPWVVDVGGGFFGRFGRDGRVDMKEVGAAVSAALEAAFPVAEWPSVRVIAEPGRYFAEACGTEFALVHTVKESTNGRQYYLTDGLHGSFAVLGTGRLRAKAHILRGPHLPRPAPEQTAARVPSTVFGPTCDSWDRIMHEVPMPLLRRGDWLQFPDRGAYSLALASAFNGIDAAAAPLFYVWSNSPVAGSAEGAVVLRRGCVARGGATGVPERQLCLLSTPADLGLLPQ